MKSTLSTPCLLALVLITFAPLTTATDEQLEDNFSDCADCPEMVVIPAGSVTLGSHPDEAYRLESERLKTVATIAKPFAMAKTEVTVGQFRQFMAETKFKPQIALYNGQPRIGCNYFDGKGYGYVAAHSWQNPGFPQRENDPVVCVSWSDAKAFAEWMSKKSGRQYRLPSSVEFEYAMRVGSSTPWEWGTSAAKACEYGNIGDRTFARAYPNRETFGCDDGHLYPTAVGSYKPNGFGLYDMLGNAWEWTEDCWHNDMTNAPVDGSAWLAEDEGDCERRTPKGGGWVSGPAWARAAVRSADGAHYRSYMLGFRLAANVE